jgi:hypothetical protein
MENEIDILKKEAVQKARESGRLEEFERAASIWKLTAESQKNTAEADNNRRALRHESVKSWAQILVPLVSVLTLGFTLWNQSQQQSETRMVQEDSEWRSAISAFSSASAKTSVDGAMAQVRLKPFFQSERYGEQATQLARLMLPHIADQEAFEDLFNTVSWHNPGEMAKVTKGLKPILFATLSAIEKMDSSPVGGPPVRGLSQGPTLKERAEEDRDSVKSEITFVCNKIAESTRKNQYSPAGLDFRGAFFNDCDLSNAILNGADLTDAEFQFVTLDGAHLTNVTGVDTTFWYNTAWWQAQEIGAALLKKLMDEYDPGSQNESAQTSKPTKPEYMERAMQLCKSASIQCSNTTIKFTETTPNK